MSMYDALPRATTQVEPSPPSTLRVKMQSLVDPIAAKVEEVQNWVIGLSTFNVMSYGAVDGGDATTNTTAINNAFAAVTATGKPGTVLIPSNIELPVNLDTLTGASDCTLLGGGALSTAQTTAGAFIIANGKNNFTVENIRFESPNDNVVAIQLINCDNPIINRCRTAQCRLTVTGTGLYAAQTDANSCTNVTVTDNICTYTGVTVTGSACIWLYYVLGGKASGNTVVGYNQGIVGWGGDADPAVDGALGNVRKCRTLTITANTVTNAAGGAIWFSMCEDITVTGNTVADCGDVGIDFEGCIGGTASGNTASNCVGGNYTTFFYNRAIVFKGNVGIWDTAGVMSRVQNVNSVPLNKDITFTGNTFFGKTGISVISCEVADRLMFKDNTLTNTCIDTMFNNQRITTITGNSLLFDVVVGAAFQAINTGMNHAGGRVNVKGNEIESTVVQPAGSRAIRSYQDDPTAVVVSHIDDNECIGFGTGPIEVVWAGANAGIIGYFTIRRNNLGVTPAAPVITQSGAAAATVLSAGNYYDDTTAAP